MWERARTGKRQLWEMIVIIIKYYQSPFPVQLANVQLNNLKNIYDRILGIVGMFGWEARKPLSNQVR